jgi:hypothetical protein
MPNAECRMPNAERILHMEDRRTGEEVECRMPNAKYRTIVVRDGLLAVSCSLFAVSRRHSAFSQQPTANSQQPTADDLPQTTHPLQNKNSRTPSPIPL